MKLDDLIRQLQKSQRLSAKADVFVIQTDKEVLRVSKVRTKGDLILLYAEPNK